MPAPSTYAQSRILIGIATIVTVAIFAVIVLFSTLIWPVGCGGDGGYPYVAPASPRGGYCEATLDTSLEPVLLLLLLLPLYGSLALGIVAVVKRTFKPLLTGIVIAIIALAIVLTPMMTLESRCTDEQRATLPARECQTTN